MPRFMVLVKASEESEAGVLPTTELLAEMGKFNEGLAAEGRMLAGEGLHPTSKGARIRFSGRDPSVTDGPFAETKELVAGFWIIRADSLEDAVERMKSAPFEEGEIEIRQIFEAEDFGDALTPEVRERGERVRAQVEQAQ